jgi:hypothetical protein
MKRNEAKRASKIPRKPLIWFVHSSASSPPRLVLLSDDKIYVATCALGRSKSEREKEVFLGPEGEVETRNWSLFLCNEILFSVRSLEP